jgi:phospholipase C
MALGQFIISPVLANESQLPGNQPKTQTPIKHVIVIIGENRSFDHVFATYVPKPRGESIFNLLSEGIIKLDKNNNAAPGPHFDKAQQLSARDVGTTDAFLMSPPKQEFPQNQLPAPLVGGPKVSYIPNQCGNAPITSCEASLTLAQQSESGLDPDYYQYLLTGGTGQTSATPDQRISEVNTLPAGPFQLTNNNSLRCTASTRCGNS